MTCAKRLIDANTLIRLCEQVKEEKCSDKESVTVLDLCIELLRIAPTVDAVEVVRCKEQTPSKADRIRAISDEGLTAFLMLLTVHGQRPWCDFHCEKDEKYGCENCISRWLKQPAAEET